MNNNIVRAFRKEAVPLWITSKEQLIAWALVKFQKRSPIRNGEFLFDLRCSRFGGTIANLREKGWVIDTVCVYRKKGLFTYQLKELPKVDKSSYMKAYTKHLDNASANMEVL